MARWIGTIGILALLVIAWVLFEIANVWSFNADRILVLRLLFAVGATASVAAFMFGQSRLLPSVLIAGAFVSTTIYSHAITTIGYVLSATIIVVLLAALGSIVRPPVYVR